jgi:hypothetical protein
MMTKMKMRSRREGALDRCGWRMRGRMKVTMRRKVRVSDTPHERGGDRARRGSESEL